MILNTIFVVIYNNRKGNILTIQCFKFFKSRIEIRLHYRKNLTILSLKDLESISHEPHLLIDKIIFLFNFTQSTHKGFKAI